MHTKVRTSCKPSDALSSGSEQKSKHSRSQTDSCYCELVRSKQRSSTVWTKKCCYIVGVSQSIREKELRLRGVSVPCERRPNTGSDHGNAIKSEAREAVERPSVWDNKSNLRVKRQDPLPRANDRWRKESMLTLGYRNGRGDLNHYRSVFGLWVSADKRKTGQRSLTQQRTSV